jgi:hypothetical protein
VGTNGSRELTENQLSVQSACHHIGIENGERKMPPPKDPEKFELWRKRQQESQKKSAKIGILSSCFKPKVEKICPICQNTFWIKPSHADQICCSVKCMGVRKSQTDVSENNNFFGRTHTPEVVEILRQSQIDRPQSESTRKKRSDSLKKVIHTKEWKDNQSASLKGREITWTDKISAAHQGVPLDEWEGYTTPLYRKIRTSQEYYDWRLAVFERDGFCDWFSGVESKGNLNAHHIVPFAQILDQHNITTFEEALKCEELWDINNGVTMIDTNHAAYHQMW